MSNFACIQADCISFMHPLCMRLLFDSVSSSIMTRQHYSSTLAQFNYWIFEAG